MDFELEQNNILCYEKVGQATICQEETQEAIVPDACPDILRIVDVVAQTFSSRYEAKEGQAAVFGTIQAVVLYLPEQGGLLERIPIHIPFTMQTDMQGVSGGDVIQASVRLRRGDARVLNPRKVLLRCDIVGDITALTKKEHCVSSGVNVVDPHICQRQDHLECERIVCVPHRIFPVSEEIRLTGTQAPTLLSGKGRAVCSESRIIGSKLIFKGKLELDLLMQDQDGGFERRTDSFPFSQILDAKGAEDGDVCRVWLELCEFNCVQRQDDPFCLNVDGEMLAISQVCSRDTMTILTDLYSTSHQLQVEQQVICLKAPCEQLTVSQTLRDLLETEDMVRSIFDCRFDLGQLQHIQEEGNLVLNAQGQITVLYVNEERQAKSVTKEVSVSVRTTAAQPQVLGVRCEQGELFAAPCTGGIEVRLSLEFSVITANPVSVTVITGIKQGQPRDPEGTRPSAILRLPEPGENLWDIAKACGTTKEQILRANDMTEEDLTAHKMLLIPSVR